MTFAEHAANAALDRARAAEAEKRALTAVLVTAAKDQQRTVNNLLTVLLNAAEQGDQEAKTQLTVLVDRLERARAVARGIHLPAGAALPASEPSNGQPH